MTARDKWLYCVETPDQARITLAEIDGPEQTTTILALTPSAEYALERLGKVCRRPSDYVCERDFHQLGVEQLGVVDEVCRLIDEAVLSEVEAFRSRDLRPGSLSWYHLKNLLNSVAVRAFMLSRVFEAERPDSVVYFDTPEENFPLTLEFVRESPWPRVIPAVCRSLDIPFRVTETDEAAFLVKRAPEGSQAAGFPKDGLTTMLGRLGSRHSLQTAGWLRHELGNIARGLRRGLMGGQKNQATIVTLNEAYSLQHVIDRVRATQEFRVLHLNVLSPWDVRWLVPFRSTSDFRCSIEVPDGLEAQLANALNRLENSEAAESLFTVAGVPCFEVLRARLVHLFTVVMKDMLCTYLHVERAIRRFRPSLMIASTMHYSQKVAFEVARAFGVPAGVYRHGASGGIVLMKTEGVEVQNQNDIRWSDFVFTFGDGDTRYFEKYFGHGTRFVSVGSAALDRLRIQPPSRHKSKLLQGLGLDPKRQRVFYVPTGVAGHNWPIPSRSRLPSVDFQIGRAITDLFREFPDIDFIFKPHPGDLDSLFVKYIEGAGQNNSKVLTGSFRELLHLADAFVVDYPSTTFLEMLTTDRPILFCGHKLPVRFNSEKWHPSILPMWQERIMYADDLESFIEMLRSFLREGRFEPVESSDEMLRLFGTHLDDGKSAERAVAAIRDIIGSAV